MKPKAFRLGVRRVDLEKAVALHRAGKLDEARPLYENILKADPRNASAWHFLGLLHHQSGNSELGIQTIQRALDIDPAYADAHNNLGNIFRETNRLDAAHGAFQRVIELVPNHADAWNNLGVMRRGRGQYGAADEAYARAIAINPSHAAAWQNRASLQARLNQFDAAVACYRRALELQPRDVAAHDAMCRTLYRAGRTDEAIAAYHEWLRLDPGNSVAEHMLAACTGAAAPGRASNSYVRDTFDAFAGSFDQVLDNLGYRAPALIAGLLDRVSPDAAASLTIADAGCGTGLCAEFLRPRAARLIGVDLSAGMLARARARKLYDELVEEELSAWLLAQREIYDLIISADTLCYFGDLAQPLSAAAHALRPGGRLVFTVEHATNVVSDYHLDPTGRYSHAESYVHAMLVDAGLDAIEIQQVALRRERGHDVRGLLAGAVRPRAN